MEKLTPCEHCGHLKRLEAGQCPACNRYVTGAFGDAAGDGSLHRVARRRSHAETLTLISEMVEHTTSAEALSDTQLAECLREEITNHMPMNSRDFCLIAEAERRLLKTHAAGAPPSDLSSATTGAPQASGKEGA